jgi:hypothetical protein
VSNTAVDSGNISRHVILVLSGTVATLLAVIFVYRQSVPSFRPKLGPLLGPPKPPLLIGPNPFPCLSASQSERGRRRRAAILHGLDWTLASVIRPSCFPEREVVFSAELGRGLLARPINARARIWITKKGKKIYVKAVDICGFSEETLGVAVSLATNHHCGKTGNANCSVQIDLVWVPL